MPPLNHIEIKQERAAALKRAQAIHDKAGAEKRDLSATERRDFEESLATAERLAAQLERDAGIRAALGHAGRGGSGMASGDLAGETEFRNWFGGVITGLFKAGDETRDVSTSGFGGVGGAVVPPDFVQKIWDKLRPQTVALATGPIIVETNRNEALIPHITGDAAAAWTGEAGTISETDPTGESRTVVPKKLAILTKVSREMADDSNPAIRDILINNMLKSIAQGVDTAFFQGTGASNQPVGLKATSGITVDSTTMGANGSTFTNLDPILTAIATLLGANADPSKVVIAMHSRSWGELLKLKDSQNRYLLNSVQGMSGTVERAIDGFPVFLSNNLSITETQGTNSDASSVYVWDASQVAVVRRQDMRLEATTDAYFSTDQVGLRAITRVGFDVPNPAAVVRLAGVR